MKNIKRNLLLCLALGSSLQHVTIAAAAAVLDVPEEVNITAREGNYSTRFFKSSEFVAVRQGPDSSPEAVETLLSRASAFTSSMGSLNGFRLLRRTGEGTAQTAQADLAILQSYAPAGSTATYVFHTSPDDPAPFVPTGRIHLKFASETPAEECTALLEKYGLAVDTVLGEVEFFVTVPSVDHKSMTVSEELQGQPNVLIAVPECVTPAVKRWELPSNALIKDQWHLRNTGRHMGTSVGLKKGADARVIDAWEAMGNLGSSDVTIAIIDDGFDIGHPALGGKYRDKIVNSWDFTRGTDNPIPDQGDWHGTAVAGVATGVDGGGDIIGAAPQARLMPIRWGQGLSDRAVGSWFLWAKNYGADVINCSWGAAAKYYQLTPYQQGILHQVGTQGRNGKGSVIVFAAGNDNHDINNPTQGTLDGFAIHPNVIAVAASTSMDKRSHYSNFGKEISIAAPSSGAGGLGILTSDVRGRGQGYNLTGDYTNDFGGTSSAAPLVAGIAALVLSENPDLTSQEVKEVLQSTARKIDCPDDQSKHSIFYGYGCVDAHAAVLKAREIKQTRGVGAAAAAASEGADTGKSEE